MIVPQEIYHPLYEDKEKFIILITGGRGSGKSFNASTFIEYGAQNEAYMSRSAEK